MAKVTVVLVGDAELNRMLRRLATKDAKKVVRQAARPALRPVRDAIKADAPVQTGKLRRSLRIRAIRRSRVRFGAQITTRAQEFDGFYGSFIEWGTKYITARAFMKTAAERTRRKALLIYHNEIRKGIIRAARKK